MTTSETDDATGAYICVVVCVPIAGKFLWLTNKYLATTAHMISLSILMPASVSKESYLRYERLSDLDRSQGDDGDPGARGEVNRLHVIPLVLRDLLPQFLLRDVLADIQDEGHVLQLNSFLRLPVARLRNTMK